MVTVAVDPPETRLSLARKLALGMEILASYVRVRWLLRRVGVRGALGALRSHPPSGGIGARTTCEHVLVGLRLGRAVVRVLDLLPSDSRCLVRSLVLVRLLARRGIPSALVIGVAAEPAFAAHAWVETGSAPLLPAREPDYARLARM